MATLEKFNKSPKNRENTRSCDSCGSNPLVPHERGMVCEACGLVLEAPVLASCRPYDGRRVQNAVGAGTTLGTRKERLYSGRFHRLEALSRLDSIKDSQEAALLRARFEIRRIFEALDLPPAYKEICFCRFQAFRAALRPGTKYRNPEKLAPLSIYFSLKLRSVPIDEKALLEVSKITKKEYNAFKLQVANFMPEHARRNRIEYVLRRILEVSEHFGLGPSFFFRSKALLYKFYSSMACTTDDAIAGVAASLALLCYHQDRTDLSVNQVCKRLGIRMSTVQSRVKRIVEKHFKHLKFEGLVKSAGVLAAVIGPVLSL
ncbi:MAG: hypothetical protein JW891_18110 [Candidatus Lokiarchaeota archaeon]|nr:hypothetical protein [Candidatus Lokiarchaeota archaeon]